MKRNIIWILTAIAAIFLFFLMWNYPMRAASQGRPSGAAGQTGNRFTRRPAGPPAQPTPGNHLAPGQGSSQPGQQDRELAATIRRLANRSTEGLMEEALPDGSYKLDLNGRFQNLPLAKLNPEGEVVVGCVDNLEQANVFFGRDLETGQVYPSPREEPDEATTQVRRLGMSPQEFQFYQNLIEEAARQRQLNPNSATLSIVNNDGPGEADLTGE